MAKRKNVAQLKGELNVDFEAGVATVTEVTKEAEYVYDFFALLNAFNGRTISINITEENELPTLNGE